MRGCALLRLKKAGACVLSATSILAKKDKSYSTTDIPCHVLHKERNGNEEATCKSHRVESRFQPPTVTIRATPRGQSKPRNFTTGRTTHFRSGDLRIGEQGATHQISHNIISLIEFNSAYARWYSPHCTRRFEQPARPLQEYLREKRHGGSDTGTRRFAGCTWGFSPRSALI